MNKDKQYLISTKQYLIATNEDCIFTNSIEEAIFIYEIKEAKVYKFKEAQTIQYTYICDIKRIKDKNNV